MSFRQKVARRLRPAEPLDSLVTSIARLQAMDRHVPTTVQLEGRAVRVVDGPSAAAQLTDLYQRGIYDFRTTSAEPVIIDAGANIGLAALRWKQSSPRSRIACFEPDPDVFAVLSANVGDLPGVTLHQAALWREETTIPFTRFGADAGRVAELTDDSTTYDAQAITLSKVIRGLGHVDLLKVDIEGAEWHVLHEAQAELSRVNALIVEHHSFVGQPQLLSELMQLLTDAGFRLHVHNDNPAARPLCAVPVWAQMDLQLNLFAWRDPD